MLAENTALPDTRLIRLPAAAADVALLLARLLVGVVLIAHGRQKLFEDGGPEGTAAGFSAMGVPAPELSAWFAGGTEIIGGALLILGLLTQVAALVVTGVMAGAAWFAHRGTEVLASEGGWELVGVIGAAALMLLATGPGRFSLDGALTRARHRRR